MNQWEGIEKKFFGKSQLKNKRWLPHGIRQARSIRKRVAQYSLSGELIEEFESITAAAKKMNAFTWSISSCANGKTKSCAGYQWRFIN